MRFRLAASSLIAALLLLAGCGDEENGDSGTEVELGEQRQVTVEVEPADAAVKPRGFEVLAELPELQRAEGSAEIPAIRGSEGLTIPEWVSTVDGDVATYWARQFARGGYDYQPPLETIFERPVRTGGCGAARAAFGPFYCTFDQTIYLPVRFFERMSERFGDAAVAVIVAHENGHHVQELLGLFDKNLLTVQTELQADCLAGVWAKTVLRRGLLEPGDIGEILGLVEISGDPEGTPVGSPGAHGTSGIRQSFFDRGYEAGRPGACPVPRRREIKG